MRSNASKFLSLLFIGLFFGLTLQAQNVTRELKLAPGAKLTVRNYAGRISIRSIASDDKAPLGSLMATSDQGVTDSEIKFTNGIVQVAALKKRVDLVLTIPERCAVTAETRDGQIEFSGNFASFEATTDTGTIVADVPTEQIAYTFRWTESRPRFVADFDLEKVKEKSGGRFEIKGTYREDGAARQRKAEKKKKEKEQKTDPDSAPPDAEPSPSPEIPAQTPQDVSLDLTTARGIILINVPPNEVGSDLRERPLTEAAKAIVRSGDSLLMEAIRRAAPQYYGEYARSLPPFKREPTFAEKQKTIDPGAADVKTAVVRVTDLKNRSIAGLKASDFTVTEGGTERSVIDVSQSTAPFNLVLLLDVSGSVENYVDFIRKAARNFVDTVDKQDRVSIVIFNEDVKVLSKFTTDKEKLSESLDTFDAGGGTAYFDALAYTVSDTLRPLKGDRTAIVILTDGEDNRSFLAYDSLIGSIQESGALIYPLYVPSGLIAEAAAGNTDIDPMRKKYMSLSARSQGEGEKLARISGGVYYPITRIEQLEQAYEDIVLQLRTAYNVTYRSDTSGVGVSPRLKVRVKRDQAFVTVSSVRAANDQGPTQ